MLVHVLDCSLLLRLCSSDREKLEKRLRVWAVPKLGSEIRAGTGVRNTYESIGERSGNLFVNIAVRNLEASSPREKLTFSRLYLRFSIADTDARAVSCNA